jgi:CheY-like chemotaxis protein
MENGMEEMICFMIDDDADDREAFEVALREIDPKIECITANSGEEGLEKLDEGSIIPSYIFLDLNMPGMDGWECLREIKKRKQLKHIPVIIFSTAECLKDRLELQRLEIARYITKPNTQREFTRAISKVLIKEIVL